MKRTVCSILILSLLLCSLFGCSAPEAEPDAAPEAEDPSEIPEIAETEPETLYPSDSLPKDLSFDGTTVTTFGWSGPVLVEFYVEEQNGEIVNDAVFGVANRIASWFMFRAGATPI